MYVGIPGMSCEDVPVITEEINKRAFLCTTQVDDDLSARRGVGQVHHKFLVSWPGWKAKAGLAF